MASTWSRSEENGQTIAYELNGLDWREPTSWLRHNIFQRFPRFLNAGFGSPGGFTFGVSNNEQLLFSKSNNYFSIQRPLTSSSGKETIYVSGDDDGKIYRHTPTSDFVNNWRYETDTIYQTDDDLGYATLTGATIGEIRAVDLNGDQLTDIILPNYTLKQIIVLEQNGVDPGP